MIYNFFDHRPSLPHNMNMYLSDTLAVCDLIKEKNLLIRKKNRLKDKAERDLISIEINELTHAMKLLE